LKAGKKSASTAINSIIKTVLTAAQQPGQTTAPITEPKTTHAFPLAAASFPITLISVAKLVKRNGTPLEFFCCITRSL